MTSAFVCRHRSGRSHDCRLTPKAAQFVVPPALLSEGAGSGKPEETAAEGKFSIASHERLTGEALMSKVKPKS